MQREYEGHGPAARSEAPRGIALVSAILAMVLIGALVSGAFFASSQESRMGTSTRFATDALYAAEHGLETILGSWKRAQYEQIALHDTDTAWVDTIRANGRPAAETVVEIRRMSQRLYFMQARGQVLRGGRFAGATRRTAMIVRPIVLSFESNRALQVYSQTTVGGSARISGDDTAPTGWAGCGDEGVMPGIVITDDALVLLEGRSHEIAGNPAISEDPGLNADDFFEYDDIHFDELKRYADKTYPSGTTITNTLPVLDGSGQCDTFVQSNWGAPLDATHPCHTYFPLIYGEGDMVINSSANGQGILLVEGNLELKGGYEFYGIIIVKGTVTSEGQGSHIRGTIMSYGNGVLGNPNRVAGNSTIQYSSCAVFRAMYLGTRAFPIDRRSWMDLSAMATG